MFSLLIIPKTYHNEKIFDVFNCCAEFYNGI